MSEDITRLLQEWIYDPEHTTRIIVAEDGRSVLQVRLPLGIEQYELDARPDGERPRGHETIVEFVEEQLKEYVAQHAGDVGFVIRDDLASMMHAEGVLFYYRYLLLFQLNHYDLVIRDTDHNLHLCDLLERYADSEQAKTGILQFRPYIIRMNAAARALSAARGDIGAEPAEIVDEAVERIRALDEVDTPVFQFERIRSVNYLRSLLRKIKEKDPTWVDEALGKEESESSAGDTLDDQLREAVEREEYERAAELRDMIRRQRGES